ncbi:alpha/beta hydrolase [Kribbella sp. DT2]|uniref:alpha/beta hydrolase n=1 Tax=Kribbella sp. DT2 TaxID=3393427 RepID=UPI003CEE4ACE
MHRTLTIALAATAVVAAAVPAVSMAKAPEVSAATTPAVAAKTSPSTLKWGACPKDVVTPLPLECSTLDVPLDYRKPNGRQIEIAISRLASKEPTQRRGILLTNPGGPGVKGLIYPAQLVESGLPQEVQNAYDVIGVDPRGVGHSTPLTCDTTLEQQALGSFATYAHSPSDVVTEAKYAKSLAKQCASSKTGDILPYITTPNTARDLDRVRAALGEKKASYLGASYGSYLGAVYTTLFPKTTDRVVIDSVINPDGYDVKQMRMFARGLDDRFPDFQKYVVAHPELGLGKTPQQVKAKFFELAKELRAKPVEGMTETGFRALTFAGMYSDGVMPYLAGTWQKLDKNLPLNLKPAEDSDNIMSIRLTVSCNNPGWPEKLREYQRTALVDRIKRPMLGGSTGNIGPCAFWPKHHKELVKITDRGPSNVMLVQFQRDPGTPLAGARQMRAALGQRAKMVTDPGGGHGVYPGTPNTCSKNAVTTFLLTGERPAKDLACAANPSK